MHKLDKYLIDIVVFICGAIVMVFEITGSRVVAPWVGATTFVWTSLIAVILASLSIGYWYGGKLADRSASLKQFSFILLLIAVAISVSILMKDTVLKFVTDKLASLKWSALISCGIIFTFPSVLLGIVTPYAVKLKLRLLENSGKTVGNLYAISTAGSIFGTIITGFWLIPFFGHKTILFSLSILALICAAMLNARVLIKQFAFLSFVVFAAFYSFKPTDNILVDFDTEYQRIMVYDTKNNVSNDSIRLLSMSNGRASAIFLNKEGIVFAYHKTLKKIYDLFQVKQAKSLMIGGGANTFPMYYNKIRAGFEFDIVEIDEKVSACANKWFGFEENKNIKVINQDGRNFVRKTDKKYDFIYMDAYAGAHSIPFHLATKEFLTDISKLLTKKGIFTINYIGNLKQDKENPLWSHCATYQSVFKNLYIFPVSNLKEKTQQNIILLATDIDISPLLAKADELKQYKLNPNNRLGTIYTDDYAPTDYYVFR